MGKLLAYVIIFTVYLALSGWVVRNAYPQVPPAPTQVTYTHNLTWVDNYKIEQRAATVSTFTEVGQVGANVTTYDAVLTTGLKQCWRVRAFNASGDSTYSNEDCHLPKPAGPTSLTVTVEIKITITP